MDDHRWMLKWVLDRNLKSFESRLDAPILLLNPDSLNPDSLNPASRNRILWMGVDWRRFRLEDRDVELEESFKIEGMMIHSERETLTDW